MEKTILYEKIYSDLLDKIQSGIFAAGDKLPSEKELAEEYRVSRITSKRALDMLAENQYITRSRGRGSFVSKSPVKAAGPRQEARPEKPLIGVIFDNFGSDYGNELLRSIELECARQGYSMLFKCSYGNIEEENQAIQNALELGAKGLILMCAQGENYNSSILQLALDKFPMVLVDRQMKGIPIPCIKTDNYTAAKDMIRLLVSRGHKKICFVSHSFSNTSTVSERHNGFVDGILEYGEVSGSVEQVECYNPVPEEMLKEYLNFDYGEIKDIISRNQDHTAFLLVEFKLGVLFRKALDEMGLRREIAVFDCIPEIYSDCYNFIYVKQDEYAIGLQAVQTLHRAINGSFTGDTINIPYEIVMSHAAAPILK